LQIVHEGKSVFSYESGYSDIESKRGMNQDTPLSIMSLSKSFTANTMLHLEETTHFDLDKPII
jgi:CubicO group peptidase (beta-lactamase class C family)